MTSLPRFSVNNPVLVSLATATILIGGIYSGLTLIREMLPESRPNRILVTTAYPGATPTEIEKGITLKLEEQIKDVEGVEKVNSIITEGASTLIVQLRSGFDAVDQAVNDVESAIDTIPTEDFPEDALETRVNKLEPKFPVISVSLFGDLDDRTIKDLGERLRDDLLALGGITDVVISGARKDEISVQVKPEKLVKYGLSFMNVAEAITASSLDLPGGLVRTAGANVAVRTLGEKERGDDLYDIVIRSDQAGRTVRVADVATIIDGFEDVDVFGRFNAMPAASVTVYKNAQQDAIAISGMVRALVAGKMHQPLKRDWSERLLARLSGRDVVQQVYDRARSEPYPPGVNARTHNDLSQFIEGRLDLLKRNGSWGLLLVFLSLLLFLHWRVALWVMMGLILAIMGALIVMKVSGMSLNLITMGGLIIVLGLLVDDAIIVSEHIYSKVEQGVEPKLAAITGTEEVTWPVVCAIVTTIVAFVPLRFIEGQMGDLMGVLPAIVCVALSVSLVEALTILPSHLAHSIKIPPRPRGREQGEGKGMKWAFLRRIRAAQQGFMMGTLRGGYERVLRLATSYRYVTIGALCSCMFITIGAVAGGHVPFVLLQEMDSEAIIAYVKMDVGTPVEKTQDAAGVVEQAVLDLPEFKSVYTLVGAQIDEEGTVSPFQSHLGQLFIELQPIENRERTSQQVVHELRTKTSDIPGVQKLRFFAVHGGPGGAAIHLEISGKRLDDLVAVSNQFKTKLAEFEGVFDIVDDFDAGRREVQIELFQSARALGLTTQSLATQVRSAFYGFEAKKIQRGREDVKVMVRYPPEHRKRIYDVESMRVATPSGTLVPFGEIARLTEGTSFASIKRTDQQRTVTVTADVDESLTNARQVSAALEGLFPQIQRQYPGVDLEFGGRRLETAKSFGSLKKNFVIALLLIYTILAGLFRSYIQPLIVMGIIPFGLIGAVVGHFLLGYPFTISSLIGTIALTGIVVNDSLILVSFVNRRVEAGVPAAQAVIEAGKSRMRPILLTSLTTVLGIAPLLMESSFQAGFLIPMGISISAGLIFATVLTLLAVPSMYLIVLDGKTLLGGFATWLAGRPLEEGRLKVEG